MRREVEIINELGLHARPAAEFVRCVQEFDCEIVIHKGEETYPAGSILEIMTAQLDCGSRITLEANGPDAAEALERLAALILELPEKEGDESCP